MDCRVLIEDTKEPIKPVGGQRAGFILNSDELEFRLDLIDIVFGHDCDIKLDKFRYLLTV